MKRKREDSIQVKQLTCDDNSSRYPKWYYIYEKTASSPLKHQPCRIPTHCDPCPLELSEGHLKSTEDVEFLSVLRSHFSKVLEGILHIVVMLVLGLLGLQGR